MGDLDEPPGDEIHPVAKTYTRIGGAIMKILCTKDELVKLVRSCSRCCEKDYCTGCVFAPMCSSDCDMTEDYEIMAGIEDICEIVGDE